MASWGTPTSSLGDLWARRQKQKEWEKNRNEYKENLLAGRGKFIADNKL